jgi:hypothetical protein
MAKISFAKAGVVVNTPAVTPVPTQPGKATEVMSASAAAALDGDAVEVPARVISPPTADAVAGAVPACVPRTVDSKALAGPAARRMFEDDENIDFRDIIIPRLQLVQGVGDLSQTFQRGDLVLDKQLLLPRPLTIVVIGFRPTVFVEKTTTTGDTGRLFNSEQEVVENGGTTDWNTAKATNRPLFMKMATAAIGILGDDSFPAAVMRQFFPHEVGGKFWALAQWSMKSSAFTAAAKPLKTWRSLGGLRAGYATKFVQVQTKNEKFKTGNIAAVPVVSLGDETPEEIRSYFQQVLK